MTRLDDTDNVNSESAAHQECTGPQCAKVREERSQLLAMVKDLSHSQLISRDIELGLRAELMQARIDIDNVRAQGLHDLVMTRRSTTWRIGRVMMMPVAVAKRAVRRIKK